MTTAASNRFARDYQEFSFSVDLLHRRCAKMQKKIPQGLTVHPVARFCEQFLSRGQLTKWQKRQLYDRAGMSTIGMIFHAMLASYSPGCILLGILF